MKSLGYVVSTLSVFMLGFVAWQSASHDPQMRLALIIGMAASIAGMLLRWLSYQVREKEDAKSDSVAAGRFGT